MCDEFPPIEDQFEDCQQVDQVRAANGIVLDAEVLEAFVTFQMIGVDIRNLVSVKQKRAKIFEWYEYQVVDFADVVV